ncbi:hypothetical protein CCMA1212_002063, partial [Trichoderma ghanense]
LVSFSLLRLLTRPPSPLLGPPSPAFSSRCSSKLSREALVRKPPKGTLAIPTLPVSAFCFFLFYERRPQIERPSVMQGQSTSGPGYWAVVLNDILHTYITFMLSSCSCRQYVSHCVFEQSTWHLAAESRISL